MPDETMIEEMQRRLEEADWLSEEDRVMLTEMPGKFPEICAAMEANPALGPEEAAQWREELRARWLDALEARRNVEKAEGELLGKRGASPKPCTRRR